MTKQYSPGPWSLLDGVDRRVCLVNDKNNHAIGEVMFVDTRNPADAALISCAPELLEALQWCVDQIEDDLDPDHQAALENCKALIKKATGAQ
jgi:hypothetical protein